MTEDIPCWTRLTWKPIPATIRIFVHQDIVEDLYAESVASQFAHTYAELGSFSGAPLGNWGLDCCLIQTPRNKGGFTTFDIVLPRVKILATEVCKHCGGSGENAEMGNTCLHCENGHPVSFDWKSIMQLSASVSILTQIVNRSPPRINASSLIPQLLCFETHAAQCDCAIFGQYSAMLADWFRSDEDRTLERAEQAMVVAWQAMMGRVTDFDRREISAQVQHGNGWLNITCPEEGCGLLPVESRFKTDWRYPFSSHNVARATQQFALLAALAVIEQQARRELCL